MNKPESKKVIWITWENQLRNKTLSKHVGAKLYQLECKKSRLIRYISLTWTTFKIIMIADTKNVIVQNPSIILALTANLFCRLRFKHLIVDAHNGGIYPLDGESTVLNWLAIFILKITPLTIVTNQALVDYVVKKGGRAIIVPDPLPSLPIIEQEKSKQVLIVFICTWAKDEPYDAVIEAASKLPEDYIIYITGKYQKKLSNERLKHLPKNVKLTGFISEQEYNELLNKVDITLDLTTRENCLVCGAYESVAVEKPMILSDTKALRNYFKAGAIYTQNTGKDISDNIKHLVKNKIQYLNEIKNLKKDLTKGFSVYLNNLLKEII